MASVDTSRTAQPPKVPALRALGSPVLGLRALGPALVPPLLVVLGMAVATHSVVRYKLWIVVVYTILAGLLALWLLIPARSRSLGPVGAAGSADSARSGSAWAGRSGAVVWAAVAVFVLVAVIQLTVRPYTYLTMHDGWLVRWVFAISAVLVALTLLAAALTGRRRLADAAFAIAVVGYLVAAAMLIHLDPAPKIDVWVMLQQTADGLLHGKNMYTQNWSGSPGVQNAFTYLPMMGVLLAPGRWLAGDVRWTLVVVTLLGVLAVRLLAVPIRTTGKTSQVDGEVSRVNTLAAVAAAALLLLLPGTATQVEQAWTEPLLMACLAGWALGVQRRNTVLAVVCLALGVASKQHLVLLLPVLAAWPRFGLRKAVLSGGLAFVLVLPWIIASPKDIWHDAVSVLINFQPLIFADTLYIAAVNSLHWTPPFWLTGAAVLVTLGSAIVLVHRRNPDLATVLRWSALFLFVANLVNKQAFYNQYWLVAALVLISLAVPRSDPDPVTDDVDTAAEVATPEPTAVPVASAEAALTVEPSETGAPVEPAGTVSGPEPVRRPAGAEA